MRSYHLFLVLLFFSCEKQITETIEVEKVTSWTQFTQIYHDGKIIYNSETDSSNIYFFGENSFIKLNSNSPQFYLIGSRQSNSKPAMSNRYSIDFSENTYFKSGNTYRQGNGIKVIINNDPGKILIRDPYFSFQDFDSTLSTETKIYSSNYFAHPIGYISNSDEFITLVRDPLNESKAAILICKINYSEFSHLENELTLTDKRVIYIPNNYSISWVTSFFESNGYFIFSSYNKTYIVDQSNNLSMVLNKGINDVVAFENKLYALSYNELLVSNDNGHNWTSLGNNIPLNSRFFLVNSSLGFYVGHQVFLLDLNTKQISELVNDGLESNQIVSIKKYNNQVYVSTLSGVFYKNVNTFFNKKPMTNVK